MDIGIGLPAGVPGATSADLVEWARRAEARGFASLACIDRVHYDSYDPLVALSAAAAVTSSIGLVTSILIAPLRETTTLAKQVASLDALSGGRLTLGVAIGARGSDYDANEFGRRGRGDRLGDQLDHLADLLDEAAITPSAAVRPQPRLLAGGSSGPALSRMARATDGYIHGGGPARSFARARQQALAAWTDADRPGSPQAWAMAYFALDDAAEAGRDYLVDYYGFAAPYTQRLADELLTTPLALREYVTSYADAGCDHLVLFPGVTDPGQVDRLADALHLDDRS